MQDKEGALMRYPWGTCHGDAEFAGRGRPVYSQLKCSDTRALLYSVIWRFPDAIMYCSSTKWNSERATMVPDALSVTMAKLRLDKGLTILKALRSVKAAVREGGGDSSSIMRQERGKK